MNQEQLILALLRGQILDCTEDQQRKIKDCADSIRTIVKANGGEGIFALSLVGAEIAVDN